MITHQDQQIRIKAEQNLRTKELRNESLISFEKYELHFDEDEFQVLCEKAGPAWVDVPVIVAWV